jgi:FkbM family methyltransferase
MNQLHNIAAFVSAHPLTRDNKWRAIARVVSWQVRSRLQREVIVPWIEGTRLAVRHGMAGATGNIYCGLHEFEDMAFLLHFLRPHDLFADVGANIGSYTVLASGVSKARVIAFEPDPDSFASLSRNIALNGLEPLAKARECALGAQAGQVRFTVGCDTVNRVTTDDAIPTRMVAMDTLDRVLDGDPPTLIKLDVEGFESDVLRGATNTLTCRQLKAIISEDRSPAIAAVLLSAGFVEQSYDPFTRLLSSVAAGSGSNALFVRDAAFVQQRLASAPRIRVLRKWL